jgi:hypothetical protein
MLTFVHVVFFEIWISFKEESVKGEGRRGFGFHILSFFLFFSFLPFFPFGMNLYGSTWAEIGGGEGKKDKITIVRSVSSAHELGRVYKPNDRIRSSSPAEGLSITFPGFKIHLFATSDHAC